MKESLLVCVALLLTGCMMTTMGLDRTLDSWKGASEASVRHDWGPPQHSGSNGKMESILTYEWVRTDGPSEPTYTPIYAGGSAIPMPVFHPETTTSCTLHFYFANDQVTRWDYDGDDCRDGLWLQYGAKQIPPPDDAKKYRVNL